jgi:thiol-disulfide isomerase/thioredoxin
LTRVPGTNIAAPLFPRNLPWVNTQGGGQVSVLQQGRPLLVEFWDFCRPNSLRTLPYLQAWHERYAEQGLRIVGVHCPGFEPGRDEQAVRDAVVRLGIAYPVLLDSDFELWREYENEGWPARYLFDGGARLFEFHYGEGAYEETELAIQELLGVRRQTLAPVRPEDHPQALLAPQSEDRPGAHGGPYRAGAVWLVLSGSGRVRYDAAGQRGELSVEHPGAHLLVDHGRHTEGVLELELDAGVVCHATCFTPGRIAGPP